MPWQSLAGWVLLALATIAIALSFISNIQSSLWWIRLWDFPRLIILTASAAILIGLIFVPAPGRWVAILGLAAAMAYQAWHIFPYTPLVPVEAETLADGGDPDDARCVSLLSLNVLQDNRDYRRTLDLIAETQPELLLLMETDQAWLEAMEPALSQYRHRFEAPLSNKYGMIFATMLPVESGHILNLADEGTPSVHAILRNRAGQRFRVAALHPRPPLPGSDTDARDAELVMAAHFVRRSNLPAIVLGDFNDVGWSHTSRLARRVGEYVDPRIGRGFFATFPASWPAFRWPLDHLFFTEEFALGAMEVGRNVGSDHLPVLATICLSPIEGEALNQPEQADREDIEESQEIVAEYRESEIADTGAD